PVGGEDDVELIQLRADESSRARGWVDEVGVREQVALERKIAARAGRKKPVRRGQRWVLGRLEVFGAGDGAELLLLDQLALVPERKPLGKRDRLLVGAPMLEGVDDLAQRHVGVEQERAGLELGARVRQARVKVEGGGAADETQA